MERVRQMDAAMAAGLSVRELNLVAMARNAWLRRNSAGGSYPIRVEVAGMHLRDVETRLDAALAKPAALLFDEVFVRAMRRERRSERRRATSQHD